LRIKQEAEKQQQIDEQRREAKKQEELLRKKEEEKRVKEELEKKLKEEQERVKKEEERKREEEIQIEERRIKEEERRIKEEERRIKEDEQRKKDEEQRKKDEEQRKKDEEERKKDEEQRKKDEEQRKKDEELKSKKVEVVKSKSLKVMHNQNETSMFAQSVSPEVDNKKMDTFQMGLSAAEALVGVQKSLHQVSSVASTVESIDTNAVLNLTLEIRQLNSYLPAILQQLTKISLQLQQPMVHENLISAINSTEDNHVPSPALKKANQKFSFTSVMYSSRFGAI